MSPCVGRKHRQCRGSHLFKHAIQGQRKCTQPTCRLQRCRAQPRTRTQLYSCQSHPAATRWQGCQTYLRVWGSEGSELHTCVGSERVLLKHKATACSAGVDSKQLLTHCNRGAVAQPLQQAGRGARHILQVCMEASKAVCGMCVRGGGRRQQSKRFVD